MKFDFRSETLRENSVQIFLLAIWSLDVLKRIVKIFPKILLNKERKKAGLQFNPGLVLISLWTTGPWREHNISWTETLKTSSPTSNFPKRTFGKWKSVIPYYGHTHKQFILKLRGQNSEWSSNTNLCTSNLYSSVLPKWVSENIKQQQVFCWWLISLINKFALHHNFTSHKKASHIIFNPPLITSHQPDQHFFFFLASLNSYFNAVMVAWLHRTKTNICKISNQYKCRKTVVRSKSFWVNTVKFSYLNIPRVQISKTSLPLTPWNFQ